MSIKYNKDLFVVDNNSELIDRKVIEDIRTEIDEQYKWLMQTKHTLYDIDIAFSGIKSFIDKHIGGREDKE